MLFKDQAHSLVAKWDSLRTENDIDTVAAQTAIALAGEETDDVLDALDKLLSFDSKKRARAIIEIVQYLRHIAHYDPERVARRG